MNQLTMGHVTDPAQQDAWDRLYATLLDAVVCITPKELAARLDVQPSYFSEALHGKNNKGFRLEWLPAVLLMAPIDNVAAILRALADLRGFTVDRKPVLTAEQERDAMRKWLVRNAAVLVKAMDKDIGR